MGIANITNNILTDSGAVIGAANGVATLDSGGKIPASQLPNSVMEFKGTWSAATNTPTLANGTGNAGDVYEVSAAGTVNFGAGGIAFAVGDYVVYDGSAWQYSSGQKGTITSLTFSAPLTGGTITTSGTVGIPAATSTVDGYLSATDWTTFNGKQNALTNPVTGTGTTNYIPKFTGASAVGNSLIYDNGSNVIINATGTIGFGAVKLLIKQSTNSDYEGLAVQALPNSDVVTIAHTGTLGRIATTYGSGGTGTYTDLAFATSGTDRLYITTGGNVLIGTTTDAGYKLDVNGTGRYKGLLFIDNATASTAKAIQVWNATGANYGTWYDVGANNNKVAFGASSTIGGIPTTPTITLDYGNGRVGIGTTSPTGILHVKGQLESNYGFILESTYGTGHQYGWKTNGGNSDVLSLYSITSNGRIAGFGYYEAFIQVNGSIRLYVGTSGNVMVGTTTDAGYKLDVNGTGRFSGILNGNAGVNVGANALGSDRMFQVSGTAFTSGTTQFGIVNNPTMGTPTTIYAYYGGVNVTSATTAYGMYITGAGGTITNKFGIYQEGSGDKNYFAGNVGIGTTSPPEKLAVNGNLILLSGYQIYGNSNTGSTSSYLSMYNGTDGGIDLMANYTTSKITFGTAGSERMRITSTGQFIVGDTSMTYGNNIGYVAGFKGASGNQTFVSIAKASQSLSSQGFMIGLDNSAAYLYNRDNTPMAFVNNGTERMRITAGGNVLIGTTTDSGYKLSVNGQTNISTNLNVGGFINNNSFAEYAVTLPYFTHGVSNLAVDLYLGNTYVNGWFEVEVTSGYSNQNAIGIVRKLIYFGANPGGSIWDYGNSRIAEAYGPITNQVYIGNIEWDATASQYKITIYHTVTSGNQFAARLKQQSISGANAVTSLTVGSLYTRTSPSSATNYPYFNTNVGIGTSTPGQLLTLGGAATVQMTLLSSTNTGGGEIYFGDSDAVYRGYIGYIHNGDYMAFHTAAAERMRITSGGNVLIGTTTDSGYKLDVNGTTISRNTLTVGNGATAANSTITFLGVFGVSYGWNITNDANGLSFTSGVPNTALKLAATGAATFSSSVTAGGDIQSNGIFRDYQGEALLQTTTSAVTQLGSFGAATSRTLILIAGNSERLRITSSGNVGIGTTSPGNPLTVSSTVAYATEFYRNNAADSRINLTNTTTTSGADKGLMLGEIGTDSYFYNYANGNAIFGTSSTERMRITSGGNVLVGTTTDSGYRFDVNGQIRATGAATFSSTLIASSAYINGSISALYHGSKLAVGGKLLLPEASNSDIGGIIYGWRDTSYQSYEGGLKFQSFKWNGSGYAMADAVTINGRGYFGIGTTSPSYNLSVANYVQVGAQGGGDIVLIGGGSGIGAFVQLRYADGTVNTNLAGNGNALLNTTYGNVLIGTTTDSGYKLNVNGQVIASAYFESSDKKLKDISFAQDSNTFGAIQFNWKDKRDVKNHWGYVAQDVAKFIPDAVIKGDDGYLSVDYNQAHTFKIAKVEDEVTLLKKRVAELEQQLNLN
jgi:uncharacterized protein YaiE (UPF0345 family)